MKSLEKMAPEVKDFAAASIDLLQYTLKAASDGKLTKPERFEAAVKFRNVGEEGAQLIETLPTMD